MSITFSRDQFNHNYDKGTWTKTLTYAAHTPHFAGRVVGTVTEYGVQVMSDVWEDMRYAVVLNELDQFQRIHLHENVSHYSVDADAALTARYAQHCADVAAEREAAARRMAEQRAAENLARRQSDARDRILSTFAKGDEVKVIKGRKVPVGTVGTVVWQGDSEYGPRLGIKDAAGAVHFTATSNVERADATALALLSNGDWLALERTRDDAAHAVRASFPQKGDKVRTACGKVGKVFWKADDGKRIGVKVGPNRDDVVWADAQNVAAA